jgi:hypothetical protein
MLDKTTVSGADLAFGIQFTMNFPENRSLTFTTAYPQDSSDDDLRKLLKRMSDAAEHLDHIYRLRALRLHLERSNVELENIRQQRENIHVRNRQVWEEQGRKGPFRQSGAQRAESNNFELTEKRQIELIKRTREEIDTLEKLVGS